MSGMSVKYQSKTHILCLDWLRPWGFLLCSSFCPPGPPLVDQVWGAIVTSGPFKAPAPAPSI